MIVHETTHTRFVMDGDDNGRMAKDYAYGISACINLAMGGFDRSCTKYGEHDQARGKPLCPDRVNPTLEGTCDEKFSEYNADSWAMIAAGRYFTARCGRDAPLPEPAKAGIGTAETTGDSCRRGGNGYGKLVYKWLDQRGFADLACSGDTTDGLNRQIYRWELLRRGEHAVATLTLGGNDVLFSELVRNMLLYRDAVIEAMEKVGLTDEWTGK
ncbi:hypothetical protein AJ79_07857 [Helicocarpus griseus UAMH5409]|uniref:SGNH hydrolase-type esterase domain-containing protein n=1 Tax=Helicocarpus griseus UAMH5409 TaxID=1447875 RepID=A0A2B7WYC8_9EURO|nr:hypothetical protein AJ79_07857 [Helicocarpus griseus UAMH5409]